MYVLGKETFFRFRFLRVSERVASVEAILSADSMVFFITELL